MVPRPKRDEHRNRFALEIVGPTHGRRFGHGRMADQRTFDFDRTQTMTGNIQHVVDAAHDPVVAVGVAACVVAGQILAGDLAPVDVLVPIIVAPDAAEHSGPRVCDDKPPPWSASTALPSSSTIAGMMPGSGLVQLPGLVGIAPGSGLIMMPPVSVCHHVSTIGHRSPPITCDTTSRLRD